MRIGYKRWAELGERVSLYVDGRDWWVGLYIGPNHLYVCVFTIVVRVRRKCRLCRAYFHHRLDCAGKPKGGEQNVSGYAD